MPNRVIESCAESQLPVFHERVKEFTKFAEQNRARLLCAVQRIPTCRDEAEDIVQDALLKGFKGLPQFRGDARMGTWLYSIVQNSIRTYMRRRGEHVNLSLEYPCDEGNGIVARDFPDSDRNPEEFYEQKELQQILIAEMNKLCSQSKHVLRLCLLEELSQRAVAKSLNTSVTAVKSKVYHSKKTLKRAVCLHAQMRKEL